MATACFNTQVTYSGSSNSNIVLWEWDFGDGDTSTNQNPTHTYETAGTYTVSLTVTDEVGISNISTIVDLLSACDSGYVGIYNGCYWEEDIIFLQELIDNSDLDIEALALGEQEWEDGRLTYLFCADCGLSGELPVSIGNPTNLEYLSLFNNELTGSIPPEIGNLINLGYLNLFWNESSNLTGEIPPEIGNLENLGYLNLGYNNLTGGIPPEIWNMTNLTFLRLDNNPLGGSIPSLRSKARRPFFARVRSAISVRRCSISRRHAWVACAGT